MVVSAVMQQKKVITQTGIFANGDKGPILVTGIAYMYLWPKAGDIGVNAVHTYKLGGYWETKKTL